MRNRSPRSFTVETKSGGRKRPVIPHRASAPVAPRPAVYWPSAAELQAPVPEPRRILPSLIVPEATQAEPEPMQISEEQSPKPRPGRPPKAKPVTAIAIEGPIAELEAEIAAAKLAPARQPQVVRTVKPPANLPLGERWKRRLGKWSR